MSVAEILQELSRLSLEDQSMIRERLDELQSENIEETPEMLAAIDEGIRSAQNGPGYPLEEVRAEIDSWLIKSS